MFCYVGLRFPIPTIGAARIFLHFGASVRSLSATLSACRNVDRPPAEPPLRTKSVAVVMPFDIAKFTA